MSAVLFRTRMYLGVFELHEPVAMKPWLISTEPEPSESLRESLRKWRAGRQPRRLSTRSASDSPRRCGLLCPFEKGWDYSFSLVQVVRRDEAC